MRTLLGLLLWNAVFVVGFAVVVLFFLDWYPGGGGRHVADYLGLAVPFIVGIWLLVLGARFARRRAAVISIAVTSGILILLQCAMLALFIWWNEGFGNRRYTTSLQLLIVLGLAIGGASVWWFWRAKLERRSPEG